jgi:acyl-CoA synthetase (AMP-forming)/AMP-acid ligase II
MVTVPLNCRQPVDALTWVADDAGLALVVHDRANEDRVPGGVPTMEIGSADWDRLLTVDPLAVAEAEPDDVAVQMYTSGSTGRPKGVLLTHGGQLFSIDQYLSGVMPMDPDERLLVSAPMYHKNAQMQLKMALALGGSIVLLRRFDAEDYLRAIDLHRVTAMTGVPTMFALMFARPDLLERLDRSSVRRLSIGSAPMSQALFDQARELFGPGVVITNGYGTTEVVAVFGGHPEGAPRPDISVGHPLAAVETRLVDPATGADAGPDPATGRRQGELWVRSPGMMAGYHHLPDVTAERLTDGWYHTGDVMEADEAGWHFFVGRVDDMFSCAGENVYPGDVEQVLERCPAVHQAAVVPVPDELKGALPVAFVVAAPGHEPDEEEIKAWALANGPAYQHPRAVWLLDELPLAGTAKIDKAALAEEADRRWEARPTP